MPREESLSATLEVVDRIGDTEKVSFRIDEELEAVGVAQVLVVLEDQSPLASAALATTSRPKQHFEELRQYFTDSELSHNSALSRSSLAHSASLNVGSTKKGRPEPEEIPPVQFYPRLGFMLGTVTASGLAALKNDHRIRRICSTPEFSLIRPQRAKPAKLTTNITWGIEALNVPALWDQGLTGRGVKVCHLDTGADGSHPALKKAIAGFAEFDLMGQMRGGKSKAYDTSDHGTHTAGTIAGRPVNGRRIGVAPEADLFSAIVIEGGNVVARLIGGLEWALENQARIVSVSLGLRGYVADFLQIVRRLRERNLLPVFAVGNEGPGTSRSPGNYPESLSVGAVDQALRIGSFSSSQRFQRKDAPIVPDIVAPGVDIISAMPGGGYQAMDGTSMAAPHVAGVAALLIEAKPNATVAEIEAAIFHGCKLKPGMNPERCNRGLVDGVESLITLTGQGLIVRSPKGTVKKGTSLKKKTKKKKR